MCSSYCFVYMQNIGIFTFIHCSNVTLQHSIITHNINIKYIRMMLCVQHARTNYNNNISYSKTSHYNTMSWLTLVTAFTSSPALMKRSTRDVLPPTAAQCRTVRPSYVYDNTQQVTSQSYIIPSILSVTIYLYTN